MAILPSLVALRGGRAAEKAVLFHAPPPTHTQPPLPPHIPSPALSQIYQAHFT
jgi:hypothetical protein